MSRQFRTVWAFVLLVAITATGCHPSQPFYFREDGDLSHYVEHAMETEEADLDTEPLADVVHARAPLTISNSADFEPWDVSLEDCLSMALNNNKVIKNLGAATRSLDGRSIIPDQLLARPELVTTIYDPAIFETDPRTGVEAAMAEFDTQFTTQAFWQKTDRPQNINTQAFPFVPVVLQQDLGQMDIQFQKRSATGVVFAARSQTIFDDNNRGFGRNLPSDWFQALEAEARIPLARGRGTQINRLPIILARMRTDVSLAEFELAVRNLVSEIEYTYWDLNAAYRTLETAKTGRNGALRAWRIVEAKVAARAESRQAEAQSKEQYFFFRAQVEQALRDVYSTENNLRYLMGLAATDGRVIRPADEPSTARLEFEWCDIHTEALVRSVELRRQKWQVKQREIQLIAARNQLLPQVNVTLLHRWLGLGDSLGLGHERNGINFPDVDSQAFGELTGGDYQESRVGLEFQPPRFGARRELAGVRNAQLGIAREKARLEEMELTVSHTLTQAVRDSDTQYQLAQTNFNRLNAAQEQEQIVMTLYEGGDQRATVDLVLETQRRVAQAQADYYRAVSNYNKAIANVHYRKGSLLEYCVIRLAEGPRPKKAYWDALGRARERDASYYLNYGWSRPKVMSRGPVQQFQDSADGTRGATPAVFRGEPQTAPEPEIEEPAPAPERLEAHNELRSEPLTVIEPAGEDSFTRPATNPLRAGTTSATREALPVSHEAAVPAAGWKKAPR